MTVDPSKEGSTPVTPEEAAETARSPRGSR